MAATGSTDESFLPQIVGIFYAVFDPLAGPIVTHQVPESLISTGTNDVLPPPSLSSSAVLPTPFTDSTPSSLGLMDGSTSPSTRFNGFPLRKSSGSIGTPSRSRRESPVQNIPPRFQEGWTSGSPLGTLSRSPSLYPTLSPFPEATLSPPTCLIDFPAISEYVIPRQSLTHRLVTCSTERHKILGFPCVVRNAKYDRNEFRWNLCFVFNRRGGRDVKAGWYNNTREWDDEVRRGNNLGEVDLSAFESVVRKCGRILRGCEVESRFLSSPESSWTMHSIIEQLFEDLNSYSETSVQIDEVNNLELKLFPFFPNPPEVQNWHVPIALVDLVKIKDANWDILVTRIIPHINGINHVARIAELADADDDLTQLCIEHLLFYQVVMMQDVFQFSNIYTVKPSIQRIIKDKSVREECGNYVTIPPHQPPSWPMLLDLYSRLLCGKAVLEWAEENSVFDLGIDIRRFVSFGIIKGFLRRVHRWPIFDRTIGQLAALSGIEGIPESDSLLPIPTLVRPGSDQDGTRTRPGLGRRESEMTATSGGPSSLGGSAGLMMRRPDERTNESNITLRSIGSTGSTGTGTGTSLTNPGPGFNSRTSSNENTAKHPGWHNTLTLASNNVFGSPPGTSMTTMPTSSRAFGSGGGGLSTSHATSGRQSSTGGSGVTGASGFASRVRGGGRGSTRSTIGEGPGLMPPTSAHPSGGGATGKRHEVRAFYDALGRMLDGHHHTDQIQVRFGISWEKLEECLMELGGLGVIVGQAGKDRRRQLTDEQKRRASRGDYGRIKVVLR